MKYQNRQLQQIMFSFKNSIKCYENININVVLLPSWTFNIKFSPVSKPQKFLLIQRCPHSVHHPTMQRCIELATRKQVKAEEPIRRFRSLEWNLLRNLNYGWTWRRLTSIPPFTCLILSASVSWYIKVKWEGACQTVGRCWGWSIRRSTCLLVTCNE